MRSNKILACLIIGLLLACNITLLCVVRNNKAASNSSIAALYPYCAKYEVLRSNAEDVIKYSGRKIEDYEMSDEDGNGCRLSSLLGNNLENLAVLRISDRYCNSCVKYAAGLLSKLRKADILACLTGFQNPSRLGSELQFLNVTACKAYNIPFMETPIDYAGFPYLMVLDKDLKIEYCYFPHKGNEEIDLENINMIIDCYAKKYGTVE